MVPKISVESIRSSEEEQPDHYRTLQHKSKPAFAPGQRRKSDSHEVGQRSINEEEGEDEDSREAELRPEELTRMQGRGGAKSVRVKSDMSFNHHDEKPS